MQVERLRLKPPTRKGWRLSTISYDFRLPSTRREMRWKSETPPESQIVVTDGRANTEDVVSTDRKFHVLTRTGIGNRRRVGSCTTFGEESRYFFPRVFSSQLPAARTFFTHSLSLLYVRAMMNPFAARNTFTGVR